MKKMRIARILSLLLGLILILSGIFVLFKPINSSLIIINWLGIVLIFIGIIKIVRYFQTEMFKTGGFLISGVLDIILGVYMLGNNILSLQVLVLVLGFWQLFSGITAIGASIDVKRFGLPRWWLGTLAGVLSIIFGYLLIKDIGLGIIYISTIFASNLIISGAMYISTYLGLKDLTKIIED